ncbi:MAG: hypothetical protein ABSG53_01270 [Thermoguttaceae bacterium]|jgi:hypothetical protein
MCTTNGNYIDDGTMCRNLSTPPVPVCTESNQLPVPTEFRRALDQFEAAASTFASRFIPDNALRLKYAESVKNMSASILDEFYQGKISAKDGAELANRLRNEIIDQTRDLSSDVGRAWAEKIKAEGLKMPELQEKYANQLFKKEFAALSEAEQNEVFLAIMKSAGRANEGVIVTSARLAKISKGLLFVTAAVSVYQIATSDRPGREAVKQGAVVGTGLAVGEIIGAAAATSLVCGPGAPICVGIFVFVGGTAAAYGADVGFDHFWK